MSRGSWHLRHLSLSATTPACSCVSMRGLSTMYLNLMLWLCCRAWQDAAGAAGVVEQLTAALAAQQQQGGSSSALADTLLALLFVCCGNVGNAQRLATAGAGALLNAGGWLQRRCWCSNCDAFNWKFQSCLCRLA